MVPEHCELTGSLQGRNGAQGQHFAIRFHLRLPGHWNGRLLFQGGGGSDGVLGDALGNYSRAAPSALAQGFAVLSQDAGHDNAINDDPAKGGLMVFGFDERARANYGYASLPLVTAAAKAAVRQWYGAPAHHAYFVGCSKGGEEGMALAQRYPDAFDGIIANAPAMSLPRAAIAEAWDTQAMASLVRPPGENHITISALPSAFSDADLALVRDAVLAACDADDGLRDGVVEDFTRCSRTRVQPQLDLRRCPGGKAEGCVSGAQIAVLVRILEGPHDRAGRALYSNMAVGRGIASAGWRAWKIGAATGNPPSRNVVLGGASLASNFTTPPTPVTDDPQSLLDYLLRFDFDRDAPKIYAINAEFPHSAWEDMSARSTDLSGFRAHRGRMIVVQGVSDPVFSIYDTLDWWRAVNRGNAGQAAAFVRVYPVPGMNHCGGGNSTDQFDALQPLMAWVETGRAPDKIDAKSTPGAAQPQRSRPLCAYPAFARYKGSGDAARADSFECRLPTPPHSS